MIEFEPLALDQPRIGEPLIPFDQRPLDRQRERHDVVGVDEQDEQAAERHPAEEYAKENPYETRPASLRRDCAGGLRSACPGIVERVASEAIFLPPQQSVAVGLRSAQGRVGDRLAHHAADVGPRVQLVPVVLVLERER